MSGSREPLQFQRISTAILGKVLATAGKCPTRKLQDIRQNRSNSLMSNPNQARAQSVPPDLIDIPGTKLRAARVALGTWAMGGWMWGGTDEHQSIATIHAALARGINLIDTAPAYGFGESEE